MTQNSPRENGKAEEPQLVQTLTDLNLTVEPGTLVAIVGMVGSGKSSLLAALLNEMETLSSDTGIHSDATGSSLQDSGSSREDAWQSLSLSSSAMDHARQRPRQHRLWKAFR